jgi:predicted ATPase
LQLKRKQIELAEADFCEAITLARKMGAKSLELRATMSLARLLDKQGKRAEARVMLAEIYAWFTEGFDTADLKDAKALLDELAG